MRTTIASAWLGLSISTLGLAAQEDCEALSLFDAVTTPGGVAHDGTSLWVAEFFTAKIHRIDPATGEVLATLDSPSKYTLGLAWDGEALWAAPEQSAMLYRLDPTTGEVLHSIPAPTLGSPDPNGAGLAWDGTALWHADYGARKLRRVDPEDGTILADFFSPGPQPFGLGMHGEHLVVSDGSSDDVTLVDTSDGSVVSVCLSPDTDSRGVGVDANGVAFVGGWQGRGVHGVQLQQLPEEDPPEPVDDPWSTTVCDGTVNSTGEVAHLSAEGSPSLAARDLSLTLEGLPRGLVVLRASPHFVERPFHHGTLCLGRPARVVRIGWARGGTLTLDVLRRGRWMRRFGGEETWFFQALYRDRAARGWKRFGMSDAISVTFEP